MTTTEHVIDADVVDEPSTELVAAPSVALFKTDDPLEVIEQATRVADALKGVIARQGLIANIKGKEHPLVEAWQTLGAMLGVYAVPKEPVRALPWPTAIPEALKAQHKRGLEFGFEASYSAQRADGSVLGGGTARCMRTENAWAPRDDFALASMAQTRAISKALSGPLRFVMKLAGFEATPAEEMPTQDRESYEEAGVEPNTVAAKPAKPLTAGQRKGVVKAIEASGNRVELVLAAAGVESTDDLTTADWPKIEKLIGGGK